VLKGAVNFLLLNTVVKIFAAFCIVPSDKVGECEWKINFY